MYKGNKKLIGTERLVNTDALDQQYIEDDEGCWNWTGSVNNLNYGLIGFRWRTGSPLTALNAIGQPVGMMTVHRAQLIRKLGREIAPDMNALHSCHNRRCINPDHLYEGTQLDKMQSMCQDNRTRGSMQRPNAIGNFIYSEEEINWIRNCTDLPALAKRFGVTETKASQVRYHLRWRLYKWIDWPEREQFKKFRTLKYRNK